MFTLWGRSYYISDKYGLARRLQCCDVWCTKHGKRQIAPQSEKSARTGFYQYISMLTFALFPMARYYLRTRARAMQRS